MNWPEIDFGSASAGTVLVVVIFLILRGLLVPRRVLTDRLADAESRVKDAKDQLLRAEQNGDEWKDAYLTERRSNDALIRQNGELIEGNKTTHAMLQAFPRAVQRGE